VHAVQRSRALFHRDKHAKHQYLWVVTGSNAREQRIDGKDQAKKNNGNSQGLEPSQELEGQGAAAKAIQMTMTSNVGNGAQHSGDEA